MNKIIADYHMHSISPDARLPMEKMCLAALARGLTEIAVTDHFEFYEPDYTSKEVLLFHGDYLKDYFEQYAYCTQKFAGKLIIRSGLESGQSMTNPSYAAEVLGSNHFDYVIGSVHKLFNVDLCFKRYSEKTNEGIARKNLEMLYDLADTADFDCVGHIDLIKRYAFRQGECVSLMKYEHELTAVLKRVIERGKGLEINTSGLRQGLGETLPGLDILKLYRSLGGEILVVGSDAHNDNDVGADFEAAHALALEAGFTKLALYQDRKCSFYSIV